MTIHRTDNHKKILKACKWLSLGLAVLVMTACNESKHLAGNEILYAGNKIFIHSSAGISDKKKKELRSELTALLRPRLNGRILGLRVKLWIYNLAGHPSKPKGFRHWLKYDVGEPPVLASAGVIEKNRGILQNHIDNRGYFKDTVIADKPVRDKKLTASYTAAIGPQYTIRNIAYPQGPDTLSKVIAGLQKRSQLKKDDPYDLETIKNERTRIDSWLKQRGFYYFNPDYLLVDIDSSVGDHKVDMRMELKALTPAPARRIYHINDVVVFADYDIHTDTSLKKGFVSYEGYKIVDTARLFRPVIFDRTLVFKPGDLYRRNDHNLSLNRLVTLGTFKFVKARFQPTDTAGNDKLNVFYYLTPTEKKSLRFEISGLTRSDNSTGGEIALNWRNRNLFRGAELLTVGLHAGLEEQYLSAARNVSTRRAGLSLNLYVPRFLSPFPVSTNGGFVPRTKFSLGYDLFDRTSQYTLTSANAGFGYIFKENIYTEHQLNLFSLNYVKPSNIDPGFQQVLDKNITLRRSIEKQFIIGTSYNFNYNSQAQPNRRLNNFYFNANIDLSGNLLGLITGANLDKGKEVHLFNTPFSQYVRLEADFRHYLRLGQYSTLASRITGGVGYAWGNSGAMPFVKEFFAGGTNDIKAFRSRNLGPGSYYSGGRGSSVYLPDQPGDVKLEGNAEYRAKLFSIVRWTLFADAGNIWTLKGDTSRPGSGFSGSFMKDIAVGMGTGLRFDLSILVLRIDFAVPVRQPWLPDGSKWVFGNVKDISKYVLNLAIGYPF